MNAVTAQEQPAGFLSVIERGIYDPNTSLDKLDRLLDIQERIMRKNAETEFNIALSDMQPKLPTVEKNGAIKFTGKDGKEQNTAFAKYEDVIEAIRPFMAEHGFSLSFSTDREGDKVIVTGKLAHRAGHAEKVVLPLPLDTSGSKNNIQAMGSSLSYGKRYAVGLLLNIVTRDEDDDGNKGGTEKQFISLEQEAVIEDWILKTKSNKEKFLLTYKVEKVSDIEAKLFDGIIAQFKKKAAQ